MLLIRFDSLMFSSIVVEVSDIFNLGILILYLIWGHGHGKKGEAEEALHKLRRLEARTTSHYLALCIKFTRRRNQRGRSKTRSVIGSNYHTRACFVFKVSLKAAQKFGWIEACTTSHYLVLCLKFPREAKQKRPYKNSVGYTFKLPHKSLLCVLS